MSFTHLFFYTNTKKINTMSKAKRKAKREARGGSRMQVLKKKIKQGIKEVGHSVKYAVLLPYKPIMLVMLHKKGVPVPDHSMEAVAKSFHHHIVKGENYEGFDFENNYENLDEEPETDTEKKEPSPGAKLAGTAVKLAVGGATGGTAGGVLIIISAIIKWIKNLHDKKKAGQKLTEDEEKILGKADQISEIVKDEEKSSKSGNIGEIVMEYWWVLAIVAIFLVMRKKS